MFITFEGPEGCGKSTQAEKLKSYLEARGKEVVLSREPGGTSFGIELRQILLDPGSALSPTTELYLFAADRAEHVNKVIRPALKAGAIVIVDRYVDSTLAYQVGGRGLPEDLVRYLNLTAAQELFPDITFLLDVSSEVGLKRAAIKGAADRFEKEQLLFHKKVRDYYLALAKGDPGRFRVFDTERRSVEETQSLIRKVIDEKL